LKEPTDSIMEAFEGSKIKGIKTTLDALRDLQASLPEYTAQPRQGMVYAEQIKHVTWSFNFRQFKTVEILHMTDPQVGHISCDMKKLRNYRDWILSEPNRFVVFGGDMIDAANILSPGEPWENVFNPQRQLYKFCEFMAPLRPRILGYVGGNHERRGIKTFGDLGVAIATLLRIPYSAGQQFVNIEFGKFTPADPFRIFLWHGRGNARTTGAKAMMIYYAMKELSGGAHVTLVGHLHESIQLWKTHRIQLPDRVVDRKIAGAMSSSFLEYFGTYGEVGGMNPSDIIMARIVLESDGKWMLTVR
jgi:hypothetical protein